MNSYLDLGRFGGNTASTGARNVVILVFAIYFLDNVLLSIIVPILPNYMQDMEEKTRNSTNSKRDLHLEGKIGFLFASKSIVQLFFNPIIGYLAERSNT
uniref:Uncharacterized protein n=1 Tax=Romanomermis culicivorax TaxID=13658 RepID=A0A915IS92_ROMCU